MELCDNSEVIRVRVKKCDGLMQPEYKKFCLDPQLTSLDILHKLLAKAFSLQSDFTISYLSKNDQGEEIYLSLLSDWDLDAAFVSASNPLLRLKVNLRPFEDGVEDWELQKTHRLSTFPDASQIINSLTSGVNKTMSHVGRMMNLLQLDDSSSSVHDSLHHSPLTDVEFHSCLNPVGHIIKPKEFRRLVYKGGIDPALRRVAWRHLLNVYPDGLTGKERFEYSKRKTVEYEKLREEWKLALQRGMGTDELKFITNMVKKDVLRTDRGHDFYAGNDENANVLSLFNILVTYSLNHGEVSYCQGMSDLASPILVVQRDEAAAYLCFCGLMQRLKNNFLIDGECMQRKFDHLALVLEAHDPDFFAYLEKHDAADMLFCYRWLLLELKREFPFEDALLLLEVMWSALPPKFPGKDLPLMESSVLPSSPTLSKHVYTFMRIKALRRRRSRAFSTDEKKETISPVTPCCDKDFVQESIKEVAGSVLHQSNAIDSSMEMQSSKRIELSDVNDKTLESKDPQPLNDRSCSVPTLPTSTSGEPVGLPFLKRLPSVAELGSGNPFLIFLCLAILLQHRDRIIEERMDHNDMAMYLDKMVRGHNVYRVINHAQALYAHYLKNGSGMLIPSSIANGK